MILDDSENDKKEFKDELFTELRKVSKEDKMRFMSIQDDEAFNVDDEEYQLYLIKRLNESDDLTIEQKRFIQMEIVKQVRWNNQLGKY